MRIYGYARVSSAEQSEGHSLENQIARLKAAGCDRVLVDVESAYKRNGSRPGFEELMQLVKDRQVDKLIITNLDRLARNEAVSFLAFEAFEDAGVQLVSLDQYYLDLNHPDGRVAAGYSVLEARAYSARLSRRVKLGHESHRDRNAAYFAPFGYIKVGERLELDRVPFLCLLEGKAELSKATIARDLVEIFLSCQSLRRSLIAINSKYGLNSYATPGKGNHKARGGFHFSPAGFGAWLNNPILRGHTCYRRSRQQRQSHKHLWDLRYDTHPKHRLLTELEYRQIEIILDHNAATGGYSFKSDVIHPLSGLVCCGECRGKCRVTAFRLRSDPSQKRYSYQCQNYKLSACTQKKSVRVERIEENIVTALVSAAFKIADISQIPEDAVEPPELLELRGQLQALEELRFNPAIEQAKKELQAQIRKGEHACSMRSSDLEINRELAVKHCSDPNFWLSLPPEDKRLVCRNLIERIVLRDGQVEQVILKI